MSRTWTRFLKRARVPHCATAHAELDDELDGLLRPIAVSWPLMVVRTRYSPRPESLARVKVRQLRREHERLRDRLLATAGHQVRGPLSVIMGMVSVLRAIEHGRTRDGLDTIATETARLTRMLENLFAATRFAPEVKLRRDWIPVEDVIGTALARLEGELVERRVEIAVGPDVIAHVDPILLELLLVNLIDNAARHTPVGTPIEISARRDAVVAVIEIADRGSGIPPDVIGRPIGSSRGLGFEVCRGIADAHGGAVVSFLREGGGSVVLVTLPDAAPMPVAELARSLEVT